MTFGNQLCQGVIYIFLRCSHLSVLAFKLRIAEMCLPPKPLSWKAGRYLERSESLETWQTSGLVCVMQQCLRVLWRLWSVLASLFRLWQSWRGFLRSGTHHGRVAVRKQLICICATSSFPELTCLKPAVCVSISWESHRQFLSLLHQSYIIATHSCHVAYKCVWISYSGLFYLQVFL